MIKIKDNSNEGEDKNMSDKCLDVLVKEEQLSNRFSTDEQSETTGLNINTKNDEIILDQNSFLDSILLNENKLNEAHNALRDVYFSENDNLNDWPIIKIEDSNGSDSIVNNYAYFYMNSSPDMDQTDNSGYTTDTNKTLALINESTTLSEDRLNKAHKALQDVYFNEDDNLNDCQIIKIEDSNGSDSIINNYVYFYMNNSPEMDQSDTKRFNIDTVQKSALKEFKKEADNLIIDNKDNNILDKNIFTDSVTQEDRLNNAHYALRDFYFSEDDNLNDCKIIKIEDSNGSDSIVNKYVYFYMNNSPEMDQSDTKRFNIDNIKKSPLKEFIKEADNLIIDNKDNILDKNIFTDSVTQEDHLNNVHYALREVILSETDNLNDCQIVKIEDNNGSESIINKFVSYYINNSPDMCVKNSTLEMRLGNSSKNSSDEFNDLAHTTEESEDNIKIVLVKGGWVEHGDVKEECDTTDEIVDNKLLINFDNKRMKLRSRCLNGSRKQNNMPTEKKKAKSYEPPQLVSPDRDIYCWKCHKLAIINRPCSICPRIFHIKCSDSNEEITETWICRECAQIPTVDLKPFEIDAISLSRILSYVLDRVRDIPEIKPFEFPVDTHLYTDYLKFIVKPMSIFDLQNNIDNSYYQSCESFLADFRWMLHNSYIYNSSVSQLTIIARKMVKRVVNYCKEIKLCFDCFFRKNIDNSPNWFIETCKEPHLLIWAKLQGYPFWPGKMFASTEKGINVRFFGDHYMSVVPVKSCYLYSKLMPTKSKITPELACAIEEVEEHINFLHTKFVKFCFAPKKTFLNLEQLPSQKSEQFPFLYRSETEMIEIGDIIKMSPLHLSSEDDLYNTTYQDPEIIKMSPLHLSSEDDLYNTTYQDPETDPLALDSMSEATSYADAKCFPYQLEKSVKFIEPYYPNAQIMHTKCSTVTIEPLKHNCIEENIEKPATPTIYVQTQCIITKNKEIQLQCNTHGQDSVINLEQVFYEDSHADASLTPETEVSEINLPPKATRKIKNTFNLINPHIGELKTHSPSFVTNDFNKVNIPHNYNNSTSTMNYSHDTNIKQSISCNPTKSNKLLLTKTSLSSSGSKIDIQETPTLINTNNTKMGNSSMKCQQIKNFQGLTNSIQNTVDFKQNIDNVGQQKVLKTHEDSKKIPRTFVSLPHNSAKHHTSHPPKHLTDVIYKAKFSKASETSTIEKKLKTSTFSGLKRKRCSETQSSNTNNQNHNVKSCSTKRKCTAPVIDRSSEYLKNLFDKNSDVPVQSNELFNCFARVHEKAATGKFRKPDIDDLRRNVFQFFESLVAFYDNSDDDEIESESIIKEKVKKHFESSLEPEKYGHFCRVCSNEAEFYCCQGTYYCSDQCQNLSWKTHQKTCAQDEMLVNDKYFRFNPKNRKAINNFQTTLNIPKGYLEYLYKTEIENKIASIPSKGERICYVEKNNSMSEKAKDSIFNDQRKNKNSISDNFISSWNQPSCSLENDGINRMPFSDLHSSSYTSDKQLVSSQRKISSSSVGSSVHIENLPNGSQYKNNLFKPQESPSKPTNVPVDLSGPQRKKTFFIKTNKNINPTTMKKNINDTLVMDTLISSDPSNTSVQKTQFSYPSYHVLNSAESNILEMENPSVTSTVNNQAIYNQVPSGISQQLIHVPISKKNKKNSAEPLLKTVRKFVPIKPKPTTNNGSTPASVAVRKFVPIKPNLTANNACISVSVGCTAPRGSLSTFTIAGRKRPFSEGK